MEVQLCPARTVLRECVRPYQGIALNLDYLFYEILHPFRHCTVIIPTLRSFVLKNVQHYRRHELGPEAMERFCDLFLMAIAETQKNEAQLAMAMESLLAYLEKSVATLNQEEIPAYEESLAFCFLNLQQLDDNIMLFMVQGHHPIKKIAAMMLGLVGEGGQYDFRPLASLLKKILQLNFDYWLDEEDPQPWFAAECGDLCSGWQAGRLFNAISHQQIRGHLASVNKINVADDPQRAIASLLELPAHMDIVRFYKQIPEKLVEEGEHLPAEPPDRFAENRKLLFLFRIMDTAGLYLIHEETLREINRSLIQLIRQQTFEEIESFLLTAFKLLKVNVRRYPHASLQCIQVLGAEVFKRESGRLV